MAKKLLDKAHVYAIIHQMRGSAVAQGVNGYFFLYTAAALARWNVC
jgi:hypothetical protein